MARQGCAARVRLINGGPCRPEASAAVSADHVRHAAAAAHHARAAVRGTQAGRPICQPTRRQTPASVFWHGALKAQALNALPRPCECSGWHSSPALGRGARSPRAPRFDFDVAALWKDLCQPMTMPRPANTPRGPGAGSQPDLRLVGGSCGVSLAIRAQNHSACALDFTQRQRDVNDAPVPPGRCRLRVQRCNA